MVAIDTSELKARVDLRALIAADLGDPKTSSGRAFWCCPFHNDHNPSLVINPDGLTWRCFGCDKHGDVFTWLQLRRGLSFAEAVRELGGEVTASSTPRKRGGRRRPSPAAAPPAPVSAEARPPRGGQAWQERAAAFAAYAQGQLWGPAGAAALAYLHDERGLTDGTIRTWGLGWKPTDRPDRQPARWGLDPAQDKAVWLPRGVVIPCYVDGRIWYVKVRRWGADGPLPHPDKFGQPNGGGSLALFGLDHLTGRRAAVICEAELDAILLWQQAGDLVDVVAIGAKGAHPALAYLARLARAGRWLVALDNDADREAQKWGDYSARVHRARPLEGNDVTEFWRSGGDLRAWVAYHLARLDAAASSSPPPAAASSSPPPAAASSAPVDPDDPTTWPILPSGACPTCGGSTWQRDAAEAWVCAGCCPQVDSGYAVEV